MNIENIISNYQTTHLDQISFLLDCNKPIVVLGTGNLGKKIGQFLIQEKKNLLAFADNNEKKWGTDFLEKQVLSPASFDESAKLDAIWIVAIWSPGHSYVQTKDQLHQFGIKNIFHAAHLMRLFPGKLLPHLHFQVAEYFIQHKQELTEVYNSLSDEESKNQFRAHVNCRIELNFESLPHPDTENQYFPEEIVSLNSEEIFLDAGAYIGDTLDEFVKHTNYSCKKYFALEPDPENFEHLKIKADQIKNIQIEVLPYAVGDENTLLKFDATAGGGAVISENGQCEVVCKKIDDVLFDEKPTYLKFDIEGFELNALKGANKTIGTHHPKLAICIYHLPDDLWTIPLYIKQNFPFYNLYVRTHQFDGLDFVLYAIPKP